MDQQQRLQQLNMTMEFAQYMSLQNLLLDSYSCSGRYAIPEAKDTGAAKVLQDYQKWSRVNRWGRQCVPVCRPCPIPCRLH